MHTTIVPQFFHNCKRIVYFLIFVFFSPAEILTPSFNVPCPLQSEQIIVNGHARVITLDGNEPFTRVSLCQLEPYAGNCHSSSCSTIRYIFRGTINTNRLINRYRRSFKFLRTYVGVQARTSFSSVRFGAVPDYSNRGSFSFTAFRMDRGGVGESADYEG